MNKQVIKKLQVLIQGIEQRLAENIDFFNDILIEYKSGLKKYKAKITKDVDTSLKAEFNGVTSSIQLSMLGDFICKNAEAYDELNLTYEERGTNIIVKADNKNVKIEYKDAVINNEVIEKEHNLTSQIGGREYYIKVGQADDLLKEIGIMTKDGKIKNDMIRKYNQIDRFIEIIDKLIKEVPLNKNINILDCGCGKSYLSFVMNFYLKEILKKSCSFIGIDYSEGVIESSKKMAINLGYSNMRFIRADLREYKPDTSIDMIISLHACDSATDLALAMGANNNAKIIVSVPCCQKEMLNQYKLPMFEPMIKHGILKARMADVLTDGIRSLLLESLGYKVSIQEYISPLETPKNLMLKAIKIKQSKNNNAFEDYKKIKEMLGISPTLENLLAEKLYKI